MQQNPRPGGPDQQPKPNDPNNPKPVPPGENSPASEPTRAAPPGGLFVLAIGSIQGVLMQFVHLTDCQLERTAADEFLTQVAELALTSFLDLVDRAGRVAYFRR